MSPSSQKYPQTYFYWFQFTADTESRDSLSLGDIIVPGFDPNSRFQVTLTRVASDNTLKPQGPQTTNMSLI